MFVPAIFSITTGSEYTSENYPLPLTIVGRSWPLADQDASGPADEVYLSSDGRGFVAAWHSGAESGESAYVEIRRVNGPSFHGWVDSESRKIVQAG